jgi:hypothetical protein
MIPGSSIFLKSKTLGLCLALVFMFSLPAQAIVSCHCFKQRTFEPASPDSADPYILATARNGLLAAASGIQKSDVVRARMTGATESDLWFSLYMSTRTGTSAKTLKGARAGSTSWAEALDSIQLSTEALGPAFEAARQAGDDKGMSMSLADQALVQGFKVEKEILKKLRNAGGGNAEIALSLLLAERSERQPEAVLEDVDLKRQTWGSLLFSAGIAPESVSDLIADVYKSP